MGFLFQSLGMALFVPLLVLAIQIVIVKKREELNLERRFGDQYREYKRNTPFLIPNVLTFYTSHRKKKSRPCHYLLNCF